MDKTRYIILGYSRSGTTVTHLALMGHPDVSALDGELRPAPFFTTGLRAFTGGYAHPDEDALAYPALFDAITSMRNPDAQAYGAKTACNSPEAARRIVEVLREHFPAMKVIHVRRADQVAHYGSVVMGKRTGIMHSWQAAKRAPGPESIRLSRRQLLGFVRWSNRLNGVFADLSRSHDYLCLDNEQYQKDPEACHRMLFDFVGLAHMDADWVTSKKVLPHPAAYIDNYEQCRRWLERGERPIERAARSMARGIKGNVGKFFALKRQKNRS